jgi:4-carboxymuconolactone decarboxylase
MPISQEAQRVHDTLFPNHISTLKVTDPEFIELFDNWAFGEVAAYGGLDIKTRVMMGAADVERDPDYY